MNGDDFIWTPPQRRALLAIIGVLLVVFSWRAWHQRLYLANPAPAAGPRAGELSDRIDPNTADADALATLPGLGTTKARAVVKFRDSYEKSHPGKLAFHKPADLANVPGIGPEIANELSPYLMFSTPPGPSDKTQ